MLSLNKNMQYALLFALSALMWLTRGHHFFSMAGLPDASWAIFFVVGFYFSNALFFVAFMAQAALIDYLVITQLGVGQSCFTVAYAFLVLAYGVMWFAGKTLARHYTGQKSDFINLIKYGFLGIVACEIISNGSYYVATRGDAVNFTEFAYLVGKYLPHSLLMTSMYLAIAALAHIATSSVFKSARTSH